MVLSMERWKGKVAVVTGASAGIGAAIVTQLVQRGVKVVGIARRIELIEQLASQLSGEKGELHGLKVDISNTEEILEAFKIIDEKFGPIHILINNAGIVAYDSLCNGNIEKWKKIFDVNVIGLCTATREAIASMKKYNVDGHIIHINSESGHKVHPLPGLSVYPASKYAVTALTDTLRFELTAAGSKIKVTSLSPGLVKTEIFEVAGWHLACMETSPSLTPEDIADAAIYVLSTPPHVRVHELLVHPTGTEF